MHITGNEVHVIACIDQISTKYDDEAMTRKYSPFGAVRGQYTHAQITNELLDAPEGSSYERDHHNQRGNSISLTEQTNIRRYVCDANNVLQYNTVYNFTSKHISFLRCHTIDDNFQVNNNGSCFKVGSTCFIVLSVLTGLTGGYYDEKSVNVTG
uniref:Uncharacterized protein n=1 Tax=Glossina austeni TaxID=7395 RepID=A0A1A9VVA5_GLOAU